MARDYKNEMEFADASREHGPWMFISGQDGMVCPHYADKNGVYFKQLDGVYSYCVSYSALAAKYMWQDFAKCEMEESSDNR